MDGCMYGMNDMDLSGLLNVNWDWVSLIIFPLQLTVVPTTCLFQVEVAVNGVATDLQMKVGEAGEAFFVVKTETLVPSEYATSPIPQAGRGDDDEVFPRKPYPYDQLFN